MSRRWIERFGGLTARRARRLRIYLGAQHVTVDQLEGGRASAVARGVSVGFDGSAQAALAALGEALRALAPSAGALRRARCDLVLADTWILYDVVALDLLRVNPAAAATAVGAALADVAGVRPDALDVRWQWQADGRSVFAMALPRALLARVRGALEQAGIALESATGEFVAVYNAQRRSLGGARVVFAVGREAGAQIAVLADGVIRATRFELGRAGGARLKHAAAGVLRERGDDTTSATQYVLDSAANDERDGDDAGWARVRAPAWTTRRASASAQPVQ